MWGGVRLSSLGAPAANGPFVEAPDYERVCNSWRNENWQEKRAPVPLCPSQAPHDVPWDQTQTLTT
jgi:hypothetical protein